MDTLTPEPTFCDCGLVIAIDERSCAVCRLEQTGRLRHVIDTLRGPAYEEPFANRSRGPVKASRS